MTKAMFVFFLLGDSPESEFYMPTFRKFTPPMKMEQTEYSVTSAYRIQTLGNHPKERIKPSEHGESFYQERYVCTSK
jgi:hypothetical protein